MSLISTVYAGTATPLSATSTQSTIMSFLPMIAIFVLFWFLLIRPQQKKSKLHNQMIAELQKGDEIVTSGGILGKISKVEAGIVHLEIAEGTIIKVQKSTVGGKVAKAEVATK